MFRETLCSFRLPVAALVVCLLFLGLGAGEAAADYKPGLYTKSVCDWTFLTGPRQGEIGKESRKFYGYFPQLIGTTYWAGGANSTSNYQLQSPSPLWNPPGTRWYVTVPTNQGAIIANLSVRRANFVYADTQRFTFHPVSNGAYVNCLELNGAAINWIRGMYGRNGQCDCARQFDFASTVACVESCAAHWNDDSKWLNGPAPSCLDHASVVAKTGCLLNHRWWDRPNPGGGVGGDPTSNPGGDAGDPCGANNFCKSGLFCDASNTCVEFEIP